MSIRGAAQENVSALLAQLAAGDGSAFQRLHVLTKVPLTRFARRIVRCEQASEDIVQESFIAIWRQAARYDRMRAAAMTWMMAIVRNKAIDYQRANRMSLNRTDDAAIADQQDGGAGPDGLLEKLQQHRAIRLCLGALDSSQRRAIELAFFHDLSHVEVAQEMSIPVGTAKTWIRRGRMSLRKAPGMPRASA